MGTSGQGFSFDSPSQTKEKQLNLKTVYCMLPPLYKCVCTVSLQQDGLLDCFESDKLGWRIFVRTYGCLVLIVYSVFPEQRGNKKSFISCLKLKIDSCGK